MRNGPGGQVIADYDHIKYAHFGKSIDKQVAKPDSRRSQKVFSLIQFLLLSNGQEIFKGHQSEHDWGGNPDNRVEI